MIDPSTGKWVNLPAFGTLSGGTYSGTISDLPAGTYNLVARYAGDGTFGSSTSAPIQVTVNAENSTVVVSSNAFNGSTCIESPSTSFTYGDYIWIDATVRGISGQGLPTGSVTIYNSGNPIGTSNLNNNGVAHLLAGPVASTNCLFGYTLQDATTFAGGTHNLTASYAGDSTFNASTTAGPLAVSVNPVTVTATLTAGGTLITSGTADQLTTTLATPISGVNSLTAAPTGTVTFTDMTTSIVLGTASVVGNSTAGGSATLSTTGITASGANNITASYSGDNNYGSVTSAAVPVTVGTGTATTTTVTSSGNPTTLNGRPTFTATMTGAPASGTVTFYDGTTFLGAGSAVGTAHTSTLKIASASLNFVAGTHNITATFGGGSGFLASTSSAFVETVSKSTPTVTDLTDKSLGSTGQNFAFSCLLGSPTTNYPYQAGVQFYDGGNPLGAAQPLPAAASSPKDGVLVTTLSAGTHTITCQYVGDSNYNASALSNSQTVLVGTGTQGIYSPASPSTLTGSTATFKWYAAATSYWVDIGKEAGGNEYYQSGPLSNIVLSVTPTTLPVDGSTVWVRWYYYTATSSWQYIDYTYTAFAGSAGVIASPTPPGPLTGSSVTFNWSAGAGATGYWIDAGTAPGSGQYFSSGNIGTVTSYTVNNLPTNGSTVYITLFSLVGGNWLNNSYTYTAFNQAASAGMLTTPTPSSTLTSSTVTFDWTAGAGASAYWMDISKVSPGGNDVYQSGNLGNVLTTTVSGLPTDGSELYVTLYSLIGGNWVANAYTYYSLNATGGLAVVTSPTNNSTLSGNQQTFTWSLDSNATAYWMDVSNVAPGGNDLDQSGNLGNVSSYTVYNLPGDGSTVYVTLYSYVGGQWLSTASSYTSGPLKK